MPFHNNNKLGAKKILDKPLDALPICLKGYLGQKKPSDMYLIGRNALEGLLTF
jgi:hypothetical protein